VLPVNTPSCRLQVRCFDMEAQRFDLCYSTPSRTSHDYWLQHSCLTDQGQGLLLGDSAGYCAAVDLRSNKVCNSALLT